MFCTKCHTCMLLQWKQLIFPSFIPYNIGKLVCTGLQKIKSILLKCKKNQIILNLEETSVREHFKELEILTVYGQDILDVILLF